MTEQPITSLTSESGNPKSGQKKHTPRIATVGCGYFSQYHHEAWSRLPVYHVGVCDHQKPRANAFQKEFGVEDAFDNFQEMMRQTQPDLVDIILPPEQHLEHIRLALESGAHVICQKPFTQNIEQARSVTELTKTTDRLVVVHENFRFQPWYRKIKSLIQNGLVGQIYQVQFRLRPGDGQGADAYLARQPYFQKMPRFLIQETGIHFIDVFRYLLGEPHSLFADLYRLNPAIKGEDAGIFSLEFDHRLRAIFDGNRLADHPANNRRLTLGEMHMEGEIGSLLLNGDGELLFRRHGENESSQIEFEFHDNAFGGDCVYELQKHVLTCLKTGTTPENLVSDYLKNLIIQEYIYQSSSQGKRLELPRFT